MSSRHEAEGDGPSRETQVDLAKKQAAAPRSVRGDVELRTNFSSDLGFERKI